LGRGLLPERVFANIVCIKEGAIGELDTATRRRVILYNLLLIILVAAGVYGWLAGQHPLSDDEASYGVSSLAILDGDFLLHDKRAMKPFMVYYTQAAARAVLGKTAFAGKVPGILATLLSVWLLFRIARRWFDEQTALLAALLLAFSPLVMRHYPNARTDAQAAMFVLLAAELAGRGRTAWAAFAFACGLCARQLAVVSFPLVFAFGVVAARQTDASVPGGRLVRREVGQWIKGALVPMLLLVLWSVNTESPFAWMIKEFKGEKYSSGSHLKLSFFGKLGVWLDESGMLLGAYWLTTLALAVIAVGTVAILAQWLRPAGRRRLSPKQQMWALIGVFVLLFYAFHSLWFFTTYGRFLAPVAPWAILAIAAWPVAVQKRLATRRPRLGSALAVLLFAVIGLTTIMGGMRFMRDYHAPRPIDDIPPAVDWVEANGGPQPVFLTGGRGAEAGFAAWYKEIKVEHFGKLPEKLTQHVYRYVAQPMYLYLSDDEERAMMPEITERLTPAFRLIRLPEADLTCGSLWRIEPTGRVGVDENGLTYLSDGQFVTADWDCRFLGRLLGEALAEGAEDSGSFTWHACEAAPQPKRLSFALEGFTHNRLRVAHADFDYHRPAIRWATLLAARRLAIDTAAEGSAVWLIGAADLASYIQERNRNLKEIAVRIAGERIVIDATADLFIWRPKLRIEGAVALDENRLLYTLEKGRVGDRSLPEWLLRLVENEINPVMKIDLGRLALKALGVEPLDDRDPFWPQAIRLRAGVITTHER